MTAAALRRPIALGACLAVCAAVSAAVVRPAFAGDKSAQVVFPQGSEQPLSALQDIDVIEHLGDRVPGGLIFADGAGKPVSLDGFLFQGKPVLVTMGYHRCPMLCGLVLEGLVKTMKESGLMLGKDFRAVSISIDPNEDRKAMADQQTRILTMAIPAGAQRADDWPFLMGNPAGATALADAIGFKYKYDEQSKQFAHAAVAFVLTPEGKVSRYLYGVDFPARDFKLAMLEAGGGRVGTSFDRVVLSCFRYDPVTRRYAPFVLGFMRIGASTVFFALATLLVVLWRKEIAMRKRRAA
ncbi:MAG TPA: SCO family protein [Polyangia bacterium]|nr:SCO family protein [Polyangia bacterium]